MSPSAGAYLQMAVSFNYRCLALFTDTGYIWMGLATLKVSVPFPPTEPTLRCAPPLPLTSRPDGIPAASLWAPMDAVLQPDLAAGCGHLWSAIRKSTFLCFFHSMLYITPHLFLFQIHILLALHLPFYAQIPPK